MELKIKNYKFLKIKKNIKDRNLLFICNTNNEKNSIYTNQKLKNIKINSYKVSNPLIKIVFNKSVFCNLKAIINSLIAFLVIDRDVTFKNFKEKIPKNYVFLAIKLNNKFYLNAKLNKLLFLNNKENNLILIILVIKNIINQNLLKNSK